MNLIYNALFCAADEIGEEDEELQRALAASMEGIEDPDSVAPKDTNEASDDVQEEKNPSYPPLPEEPKGDRNLLCRVAIRFPDGRRLQRNFLRTDSIKVKLISQH